MQPNKSKAKQIDALLPQTQCGLCGYKGCLPYAEALAEHKAAIDLCPPGGVPGLLALAEFLNVDPAPYLADMEKKAKPQQVAFVREAECIGCTKCIQACPVDAILGSAKQMHSVISSECTGCELCIAPCPVDCIEMLTTMHKNQSADYYRERYQAREIRITQEKKIKHATESTQTILTEKKNYIENAIVRARAKRSNK